MLFTKDPLSTNMPDIFVLEHHPMAKPLLLKCRSAAGQHQIKDLDTESTLMELKAFILSLTGMEHDRILLKSGFPPTPIDAGGYTTSIE